MRYSELSPERQRLLSKMREVGFGNIVDLQVRNGDPVLDTRIRVEKDIALNKTTNLKPYKPDMTLNPQVIQMLKQFSKIWDGTIHTIRVQDGLPFRLQVIDKL